MSGTFSNDLINNTIYHVLNFEKHSNFQAAAREAAINNNFQIVLLSEDFNQVFTVETQYKTTIDKAIRKGIERGINRPSTMIDVEGVLTYWGPVMINGIKHYLMLVDNEGSYSKGEITKLAEILELAMGMWKYSPVRDVTAEFIKALRRGNRNLAYTLKEEGEFGNEKIKAVFTIGGIEKDVGLKAITNFEKKTDLKVLKIAEGDEISGVVLDNSMESLKEKPDWQLLCNALVAVGAKIVFYADGIDQIDGAADSFQLINETWPFMQYIFPHRRIFTKHELALVGNCIDISLKGGMIKKYYLDLLEPFKKIGENKGRQLQKTLEIFVLDEGMKAVSTAERMSLHTNTIQYRLKRIKEILGVDIMETTIVPSLVIALALERIEIIVKSL